MTMTRLAYRSIPEALGRRREFHGNTMRAEHHEPGEYVELGRLPSEHHADVRRAVYVVFSYHTPIAWVREDGEVVVPDERYSVTTSRQQSLARAWLR